MPKVAHLFLSFSISLEACNLTIIQNIVAFLLCCRICMKRSKVACQSRCEKSKKQRKTELWRLQYEAVVGQGTFESAWTTWLETSVNPWQPPYLWQNRKHCSAFCSNSQQSTLKTGIAEILIKDRRNIGRGSHIIFRCAKQSGTSTTRSPITRGENSLSANAPPYN